MPTTRTANERAPALLLADGDELTYRVMRCVNDAGMRVHVLGTAGSAAARLARSRYCAGLHAVRAGAWASGEAVHEVNALAHALGAQIVLASDPATTRFVVWHGRGIAVRTFPVPAAAAFERLVNKDSFAQVCAALGLPHPATTACDGPQEVLELLQTLDARPVMIKPVDAHAGHGVWKLERRDEAALRRIRALDHHPIVVQEFIEGSDVNALLLCKAGDIVAAIAYGLDAGEFRVVDEPRLWALLARAASALQLDGAIGFDMRVGTDGRPWFIECNPRFTYEGSLVGLLSGYNIIREFLVPGTLAPRAQAARLHRARLLRPWSLLDADRRHARYLLSDLRHSFAQACREFYVTKLQRSPAGFSA
ncbi:ATP-grasp domain-containing protein [Ramlibacter sp. PS4R-6]|uniref:ATP-grasp domain-containing protein n=1 Tax=Ramlibacter sp. PS4R-6 TaxID=3133438 RepID=UPI0030ACAF3F